MDTEALTLHLCGTAALAHDRQLDSADDQQTADRLVAAYAAILRKHPELAGYGVYSRGISRGHVAVYLGRTDAPKERSRRQRRGKPQSLTQDPT